MATMHRDRSDRSWHWMPWFLEGGEKCGNLGHSGGSRSGETHDVMEVALYRWIISWNIPTANWMRTGGIPSDLGSPFFFEKHISDAGEGGILSRINSHGNQWESTRICSENRIWWLITYHLVNVWKVNTAGVCRTSREGQFLR